MTGNGVKLYLAVSVFNILILFGKLQVQIEHRYNQETLSIA